MAKYIIEESTLKGLGDALRKVTGENRTYTPTEMIQAVTTIMDAATYILVDEDGNEVPAVFVENATEINATANDIRLGTTAVTAEGITPGTKEIPAYYAQEGTKKIPAGDTLKIPMYSNRCNYTKLQALICTYNTSISDSVATEKVSINNKVYNAGSTVVVAEVTVNAAEQVIDFGITNTSNTPVLIRYFTFTEE